MGTKTKKMKTNHNKDKLVKLTKKLNQWERKLAKEMIGYRGIKHESAASEIKHSKVMVYKAMVNGLKTEIKKLEDSSN